MTCIYERCDTFRGARKAKMLERQKNFVLQYKINFICCLLYDIQKNLWYHLYRRKIRLIEGNANVVI
jgi:hypothetical protein